MYFLQLLVLTEVHEKALISYVKFPDFFIDLLKKYLTSVPNELKTTVETSSILAYYYQSREKRWRDRGTLPRLPISYYILPGAVTCPRNFSTL